MTLIYAIFTIILPWPRILFYGKHLLVSIFLYVAFPFVVGVHMCKGQSQTGHLVLQYSMVITLGILSFFLLAPFLNHNSRSFSDFASFMAQTDSVKGDPDSIPDPYYVNINAACNGIFACTSIDYLTQAFSYVTAIAFGLFVLGYYVQWTTFIALGCLAALCCGFKYCCIDLKWVPILQRQGEEILDELSSGSDNDDDDDDDD